MNLVCYYCKGTGWRIVTTQGQHTPDSGHTYACTTIVVCECMQRVITAVTVVSERMD